MKLTVEYTIDTPIGLDAELDDKIHVFFKSLGFESVGSGSGMGKRDIEFDKQDAT